MGVLGLIMFLIGSWGLKKEYFGEKWKRGFTKQEQPVHSSSQPEDSEEAFEKELERHLHIGITKTWGCFLIGILLMLLSPWDCRSF